MITAIIRPEQPSVSIVSGTVKTTSLAVAEFFVKPHKDVLEKIRALTSQCDPDFNGRNFPPVEYTDEKGEKRPAYELTRDGFTLLAMGFTGKRALQWKIAYINAFNAMESELHKHSRSRPETTRKALPNGLSIDQQAAIKQLVKARVEACPKDKQAKAAITCWSALKSKFGVGYKEIAPEHYADALSLVARLPLEGELLEREQENDDYPVKLKSWEAFNLHGLFCHVRVMCEFFDKVYPALRQLASPLAPNYCDNFRDGQWVASSLKRISAECEGIYKAGTKQFLR